MKRRKIKNEKKCKKCELNPIKDDEEYCSICLSEINPEPSRQRGILGNDELGGKYFDENILGFGLYLVERNYGTLSENSNPSTTLLYSKSLIKIGEIEGMCFADLMSDVDRLVREYAQDGIKKKLGETQHGTWRNALCRLKDFASYRKNYMKQQN